MLRVVALLVRVVAVLVWVVAVSDMTCGMLREMHHDMGRLTRHVTCDRPCDTAYDMHHVTYVTYDVTYNMICDMTRDVRSAAFLALRQRACSSTMHRCQVLGRTSPLVPWEAKAKRLSAPRARAASDLHKKKTQQRRNNSGFSLLFWFHSCV